MGGAAGSSVMGISCHPRSATAVQASDSHEVAKLPQKGGQPSGGHCPGVTFTPELVLALYQALHTRYRGHLTTALRRAQWSPLYLTDKETDSEVTKSQEVMKLETLLSGGIQSHKPKL